MSGVHRKRLAEIDQQLFNAEQALDKFGEASSQGKVIVQEIARLQKERSALPPEILHADEIGRKRAELAKNAGLLRLIRQRGEVSMRATLMQKTVDQLRETLGALGVSEADINAAIQAGEADALRQNELALLAQITAAVKQMVLRCYEQHQPFPAHIGTEIESWLAASSEELSPEQGAVLMRWHQAAVQKVPLTEMRAALVAGTILSDADKAKLLGSVTEFTRTLVLHRRTMRKTPLDWVEALRRWASGMGKPDPKRELALFKLCQELRAYGVAQAEIEAAVRAGM